MAAHEAKPAGRRKPATGTANAAGVAAAELDEPHVRVLQQFRIVFNAVKTHFQQVERKAGIGGAQVWALSIVQQRPGLGVNELAKALNVRQPTASNLVRHLADQGYLEARRGGVDRRAVQLRATRAGAAVLARAPGPFSGVLPAALEALPAPMLARLEADLGALIRQLGADDAAAKIPLAQL